MSVVAPTPPPAPPAPPTAPFPPTPPQPPRSTGRVALQIGAVITGVLIILGALNLFQLMGGRSTSTTHRSFTPPSTTLTLAADSADVTVVTGDSGTLLVDRRISTPHGRTVDQPSLAGNTLTLPSDCNGSHLGWLLFCSVSYVVHVPDGLNLTVRAGSGDVRVEQTKATALTVRVGSGDVRLSDVTAPTASATTGSGDVDIDGLLSSDTLVRTGSGDVQLSFSQAPTTVQASTGSGDLTVGVPRDQAVYTVHQHNGSGDFTNHLLSSDQPPADGSVSRVLTVSTGSGDLTLEYTN
jgi:hypothetical protein